MDIHGTFPFRSYRQYQDRALWEAANHLDDGKSVILDLPTGIGKSPICATLCRLFPDSYYTTPQRSLRLQLGEDETLQHYYKVLEARADYVCNETGERCDECPHHIGDSDLDCSSQETDCTYMDHMNEAMKDDTVVMTMSRLLIEGQKGYARRLDPRNLLIVDEAHSLEQQTASMHASIKFTPREMDPQTYAPVIENIDQPDEDEDRVITHRDVLDEITEIQDRMNEFIRVNEGDSRRATEVIGTKHRMSKLAWFWDEVRDDDDRVWLIDLWETDDEIPCMSLMPESVDRFLARYFWSNADQFVLATATPPYRGNEGRWLYELGLPPSEFEVVSYPSPFPVQNRLVHTRYEIGKMSQEEVDIWRQAVDQLAGLAGSHRGDKGLIHCASYERAQSLVDASKNYDSLRDNVMSDRPGESTIEEWQRSSKDLLCSPSMMEGVDLKEDMCRWQVLFKVPYPHPSDPRVQYRLNEDRWHWYNQKAAVKILQMVGRAVRSEDDHADFYVFDSSFEDVRRQVTFPQWFEESIC